MLNESYAIKDFHIEKFTQKKTNCLLFIDVGIKLTN